MTNYCCFKKCFKEPTLQVDGRACDTCNSFGYCMCKCLSFTNMMYITLNDEKNQVLNISFNSNFYKNNTNGGNYKLKTLQIPEVIQRSKDSISNLISFIIFNQKIFFE